MIPSTLRSIPKAVLAAALLIPLAFSSGCGDDAAGGTPPSNNPANNTVNNTTNNTAPGYSLTIVGESQVTMNANSAIELTVAYADPTGAPVANAGINWATNGQVEDAALESRQSSTDGTGRAKIRVLSGTQEAIFNVAASVADNDGVAPVSFQVSIESKDQASYRVIVEYDGPRRYTDRNIKVALFDTIEECATNLSEINNTQAHPLRIVSAVTTDSRTPDAAGFPMTFSFMNLPNGTAYTALAVAFTDTNDRVVGSWGCNDTRPVIQNGEDIDPITINMTDLVPDVAGSWNIKSNFNLIQALPPNVQDILNPVLDFFADPAGVITDLLIDGLRAAGMDLGGFETVVSSVVTALLESYARSNETVASILNGAQDVEQLIRNFQLEGTIVIDDSDVTLASDSVLIQDASITYSVLAYRWRATCSAEELAESPDCGYNRIDFDLVGLSIIEAAWDGGITANADYNPQQARAWFHELSVQDHAIRLNYGALVTFLVEQVVLPIIFDDPNINSLNALVQEFINCDELFPPETDGTFNSICDAGLNAGSDALRDWLTDLSYDSDNFTMGTPDTTPCGLYEVPDDEYGTPPGNQTSHAPRFASMGQNRVDVTHNNTDLRCYWDANIQFSDDPGDATNFEGRWSGQRHQ